MVLGVLTYAVVSGATADALFSGISKNRFVDSFLTAAIAIPLNALLIGYTGGTLGKWLLGVRVLGNNGGPIGFVRAFRRECDVWVRGVGLYIPLITIVTCIVAYSTLKKTRAATWDTDKGIQVVHRDSGLRQVAGTVTAVLAFAAVIVMLSVLATLK
jgi:hypothetical protein